MIYRFLGLYDTLVVLIISSPSIHDPKSTLPIRSYILSIPKELEGTALVDGAIRL